MAPWDVCDKARIKAPLESEIEQSPGDLGRFSSCRYSPGVGPPRVAYLNVVAMPETGSVAH